MISVIQKITPPRKKLSFWEILPWAWLILSYCITMGFLALHGRAYIDSDMSGEMVLADLLNQEHSIISQNWGYSTEIRIFYLQIFYRIALLIFPHNWYAARMLGQGIWMLLLIASYLYVGHALRLKQNGVWGAAALACPFGIWYFWYGAFGGFYLPHMILLLLSFGLILHFLQSDFRKHFSCALYLIALASVSFVNGLGSIKGILAFYLPLVVAMGIYLILQLHENSSFDSKKAIFSLLTAFYALFFSACGYMINSTVLAAHYDFASHNDRIWATLDISKLLQSLCDFLSLLGFQNIGLAFLPTETNLFSLYGILGALSLVLIALVLLSVYFLIRNWKKLSSFAKLTFLLFISICLVQGSVFAFTTGSDSPNASYWLTPLPIVFLILQLAWETFDYRFCYSQFALAICFMVCIIGVSISSVHTFFTTPPRAVPNLEPVADWLSENGYTSGYASLWNCNIMTEWSNGQLDMHSVNEYTLDVTESHSWLERLDHANPPEGRVFLLVSASELWGAHKESLRNDYNVYWDENDYLVMAFDSYDEMVTAIQNAHED